MKIPKLKDFFSIDIENLEEWKPDSMEEIFFLLDLEIGLNDDRSDNFQVIISTPEAIRTRKENENYILGRHYIIIMNYRFKDLLKIISEILNSCRGNDWQEIAIKLSRYFQWEYEDHEFVE